MGNIIVGSILLIVITGSIIYIIRKKRCGQTCIGCPMAGNCDKERHKK